LRSPARCAMLFCIHTNTILARGGEGGRAVVVTQARRAGGDVSQGRDNVRRLVPEVLKKGMG
jgi:hypothetical protein